MAAQNLRIIPQFVDLLWLMIDWFLKAWSHIQNQQPGRAAARSCRLKSAERGED